MAETVDSSHFRVLRWLAFAFLVSWIASWLYLFMLDAPQQYLVREMRQQDEWSRHFRPQDGPRVIFTGGSSCMFSIDAGMATGEFHRPVINGGLGAGLGGYGILLIASRLAEPGDTIVVALEPSLLSSSLDFPHEALQLLILRRDLGNILEARAVTGRQLPLDQVFFAARPGLDDFAAFLGRVATNTPFRYADAQVEAGGLMVTTLRYPLTGEGYESSVSEDSRQLLIHFQFWARQRNIRVFYSLPWYYVDKERAPEQRRRNARLLAILADILPVVRDEELGVQTDASKFADNKWHLNKPAAEGRTSELMRHIMAGDFWTHDELAKMQVASH